jgi:hypothetical protein
MKKTSIYIEPDLDIALSDVARRDGVSKASVVRRAIQREVDRAEDARPRITGIGVFNGPGDLSSNVDRYLRETGFGED